MKNENVVMKIDLPLLRINKKTKIREMYNTAKFVPYTLFIAHTDRVSVRDKVLLSGIPGKGEVLTKVSAYWFRQTREICPNHFITDDFDQLPRRLQEVLEPYKSVLIGRFMFVRWTKPSLSECIVRNWLLGSAWDSYKETGEICGIELPKGLKKGDKLPAPIFTPSTKAEYGKHDENITFEQMSKIVGPGTARALRAYSLSIYSFIANAAACKGIEIQDTKFEFGYDEDGNLCQIDESGTGDSSRFEPDYSKQPLRDWLNSIGWDKETPIELPEKIIEKTSRDYIKGCQIITGYTVRP